ncbi:lipopolysaccharide assembly protein LapB [Endozoicomonas sp. YOMI1]|uniref:tetratricopeptide repeat protein n=1 Tax=Endozoicomonas sp. YOMI1 TaxID=2828739 RepID=UPI002148332F|nr:hypothetical protein [Endozoicomonas sp. YOMI1]
MKPTENQVVHYTEKLLKTKKKLCDNGNKVTLEREKRYVQTPSAETLSSLLDQIQSTYLKYWELQRVVELMPEKMPKSLLAIADELEQFENHMVDFFLGCTPSDPKQIQDLFLMVVWFEGVKDTKNEMESANYISISKRILSFFEHDIITNTPITKIKNRIILCDPLNQKTKQYDEKKLPEAILLSITKSLKNLLFFKDTETIKANLKAFICESELFKERDCSQKTLATNLTVLGLCESACNMLDQLKCSKLALIPDLPDIPDLNPNSLLLHALRFGVVSQITYNSPDMSLSALEQLIRFLQIPEFKKKLLPLIQHFASTLYPSGLTTICNFLINQDTSQLINIPNKDSRLYLSAVLHYLKNEPEKAESELLKSRTPEARWLLSKIYEKNNRLEEAIENSRLALQKGVNVANLQLALLLMKNSRNDIGSIESVITHLQRAIEHYDFIDAKEVSFYIQGIIDELELIETKPTAPEVTPEKKKGPKKPRHRSGPTGKKRATKLRGKHESLNRGPNEQTQGPGFSGGLFSEGQCSKDQCPTNANPVCPTSTAEAPTRKGSIKSIHQTRLSYISLWVTQLLHNSDFEQARAVLEQSCQDTQLTLQQASFAHMDLWSLRVIAKGSEHLEAFNASAKQEQKPGGLNILAQSGETLTEYGLDRQDCEAVLLSDDIPKHQLAIRNLIIDKALGWLCCLHPCDQNLAEYKAQWISQPCTIAKHHLAEFEHSLSLTFVTGSFLSLIGHIHGDMATDCDDQKEKNRLKQKSGEFYGTANEFNNWRIRLKNEPRLRHRIAKKTPLGDIQRLRKNLVAATKR